MLFQGRLNLSALFNAQCGELKPVLRAQRADNLRWNVLFAGSRERDFECDSLSALQAVSNKRVEPAFAEITCPPLQAKVVAAALQAYPNPCLKYMAA